MHVRRPTPPVAALRGIGDGGVRVDAVMLRSCDCANRELPSALRCACCDGQFSIRMPEQPTRVHPCRLAVLSASRPHINASVSWCRSSLATSCSPPIIPLRCTVHSLLAVPSSTVPLRPRPSTIPPAKICAPRLMRLLFETRPPRRPAAAAQQPSAAVIPPTSASRSLPHPQSAHRVPL